MATHMGDEQKLISVSKQGHQQLEQLWAQERQATAARLSQQAWSRPADEPPPG